MSAFVFLVFGLLGIGRNLPFESLYLHGLGAADLSLCGLVFVLALDPRFRADLREAAQLLRVPIVAMLVLSTLAMTSMAVNAFGLGIEPKDILEIFKYSYLLLISVVACVCTRRFGIAPALGFAWGVIVSGVVAYLNPMNPDVLGTPQIFNPNVIGNVLSVSVVLASIVILRGHPVAGGITAAVAAVLSFFTFSKGTWLMTLFALVACWLALRNANRGRSSLLLTLGKLLGYAMFAALVYVVYEAWETVSLVVEAKITATDFEASAAEGGSFSARWGLILSAVRMFLDNPLLGVGISNYETANNLLKGELGDAYYDDDNPNSAWFYVLGCMGLPAFICFAIVFVIFMGHVRRLRMTGEAETLLFAACIGVVFLIGGNVQVEMLTAYYYWVALGIVAAARYASTHPSAALRPRPASPSRPVPVRTLENAT
jgi:O-antigen ligase